MSLKKIISFLKKDKSDDEEKGHHGIIIFKNVKDAMTAEKILKEYSVKVVAPPRELREGCDLAVEYDLVEETGIKRELEEKSSIKPLKFISLNDYSLKPLELIKTKKIDDCLMVRCGNMKITIDKEGNILNISGGGCPDVPYLTLTLKGRNILEVPDEETPKELGYTLCAYTLNKAFEEAKRLVKNTRSFDEITS